MMTKKLGSKVFSLKGGVFILAILFAGALWAGEQSVDAAPPKSNNPSGFVLDKNISYDELKMFYDFAVVELHNANYGLSKDMFECIVEKTDRFPMSHFFLAHIYSSISSLRDSEKAKAHYEALAFSKRAKKEYPQFVQEAYSNLIDMETDKDKMLKMAKTSLKMERNVLSLSATLKAYQKAYAKTSDDKYSQMADIYTQELNDMFKKTTTTEYKPNRLLTTKR